MLSLVARRPLAMSAGAARKFVPAAAALQQRAFSSQIPSVYEKVCAPRTDRKGAEPLATADAHRQEFNALFEQWKIAGTQGEKDALKEKLREAVTRHKKEAAEEEAKSIKAQVGSVWTPNEFPQFPLGGKTRGAPEPTPGQFMHPDTWILSAPGTEEQAAGQVIPSADAAFYQSGTYGDAWSNKPEPYAHTQWQLAMFRIYLMNDPVTSPFPFHRMAYLGVFLVLQLYCWTCTGLCPGANGAFYNIQFLPWVWPAWTCFRGDKEVGYDEKISIKKYGLGQKYYIVGH